MKKDKPMWIAGLHPEPLAPTQHFSKFAEEMEDDHIHAAEVACVHVIFNVESRGKEIAMSKDKSWDSTPAKEQGNNGSDSADSQNN